MGRISFSLPFWFRILPLLLFFVVGCTGGLPNGAGADDINGVSSTSIVSGANAANAATDAGTPGDIVKRDGSGNFAAGTITASLNGNATTATTATNFSGALSGEVTGMQGSTVVTNAVSTNVAGAMVRRGASGEIYTGDVHGAILGGSSLSVTGAVSGGSLTTTGTLTAAGGTAIDTTGNLTLSTGALTLTSGSVTLTNGGLTAGNGTITAKNFGGNGSGLTNLSAANLSGAIAALDGSSIENLDRSVCGRLTLTKDGNDMATVDSTGDSSGSATLYFARFHGNRIPLYNGSSWVYTTFSSAPSVAVGGNSDGNYDVFAFLAGGSLTLELVSFSRPLDVQDGIYVKTSQHSHLYLGTVRISGAQFIDSSTKRFVWNYYNRVRKTLAVSDNNNWSYLNLSGAWRAADAGQGTNGNKVEIIVGVAESSLRLTAGTLATTCGFGNPVTVGIGEDRSDGNDATITGTADGANGSASEALTPFERIPASGYHYYQWVESSTCNNNPEFYGGNSGMSGTWGC